MTGPGISHWRTLVVCLSAVTLAAACGPTDTGGEETRNYRVAPNEEFAFTEAELASAKATAYAGDIAILNQTQMDWSTIMRAQLKTANQKTLFIDASLECGLLTKTTVRSKGGQKDTSLAEAVVYTQVLVNGTAAYPGPVIYCQRTQELSASLGGIMESCTDSNGDGTILASECTWTEEEISLMLSTMNAASYNFIASVGAGVNTIEVQAKIGTRTSYQAGSAEAYGSIGHGSVVITEERLVKGDPWLSP